MSSTILYIDFIRELDDGSYKLEGYLGGVRQFTDETKLLFAVSGAEPVSATFVTRKNMHEGIEYDRPVAGSTFEVTIRPETKTSIVAYLDGSVVRIKTNRFSGLARLLVSYRVSRGMIWTLRGGKLHIAHYTLGRHTLLEIGTYIAILLNWRIPDAYARIRLRPGVRSALKALAIVVEAIIAAPGAVVMRTVYHLARRRKQRSIWIVSDRPAAAGDNGEALYRHIIDSKRLDGTVDCYFALSKESPDYARLRALGPVLDYGSLRYKLTYLLADTIVSSQADIETTNPFGRQLPKYLGLLGSRFVFLQHGIIRHDLSDWLNRFNRNIDLFVTSAELERDSIVNGEYYYAEDQIVLSGLPRYDLLESHPTNKLILAPTYRANLLSSGTNRLGERAYDDKFKNSEYATFYRAFMSDARLIKCMKEHQFTGELYLHPVFKNQARDFGENDVFGVAKFPYNYAKAFEEGSLLVSDHSSVMFDFAYLKKPVLYAHFDADNFYATHTYTKSDLFDDEKQGFGPVCHDYDELVMQTIRVIEEGAQMSAEYQRRVDAFFAYNDKSNSKRVLDAILHIGTI